jgi:hypothetical protein
MAHQSKRTHGDYRGTGSVMQENLRFEHRGKGSFANVYCPCWETS